MRQLAVIQNAYFFFEYQHLFCNFLRFLSVLAGKWQNDEFYVVCTVHHIAMCR